ncbi:MAG TPA: hypothetical protein VL688_11620 [Verrucomicrobiae bacterium]|nr:hypothetical protein [Verrucomicrobiae bacterium]
MWLQNHEIKTIQQVIRNRKGMLLSRLLQDVLKEAPATDPMPAGCPVCRQKLVSKAFPYLEFFVKACPNQHGLWMSAEVCTKTRGFIQEQIAMLARRQYHLKLSLICASVLLLMNLMVRASNPLGDFLRHRAQTIEYQQVNEDHWPLRVDRDYFPMPMQSAALGRAEEMFYFQQLVDLLSEALSNRINIDAVLKTQKEPDRYWALYDFYRNQQGAVAARLEQMEVPEKLAPLHEKIMAALAKQMEFYETLTREKAKDEHADVKSLAQDRALQASNQLLQEAHALLLTLYPDLDKAARLAVESRFIWLEIS